MLDILFFTHHNFVGSFGKVKIFSFGSKGCVHLDTRLLYLNEPCIR
nr:MAG TPA: hypothetical protein [Ackermannviridae sp.]